MIEREGSVFPRWLVALAAIGIVGVGVWALRGVLTPVFFAFLIAYMLDPVVDRLEAMRLPRSVGIVVLLAVTLGALALFVLLAVPGIVRDVAAFATELPAKTKGWMAAVEPWLARAGVEVPHSLGEALERFQVDAQDVAGKAIAPAGAVLQWIVGGTASILGAIAGLLVVPVFAFYLLHDFDRMTAGIRELVPWRMRPFVVDVAREIDQVMGQFIRGQLTVMLILAVLYSIGFSIAGVRLAVLIGIVAGLLAFIPYVGGAVALGLAVLMCLIDWHGPMQLLWVGIVYAVVQVLDGFLITPKIVGNKVGLPAVWVLLALMVGGQIFGFLGVLLAVPAAAVAKIFVMRAVAWYRRSAMYLAGAPEAALAIAAEEMGALEMSPLGSGPGDGDEDGDPEIPPDDPEPTGNDDVPPPEDDVPPPEDDVPAEVPGQDGVDSSPGALAAGDPPQGEDPHA